MACVKDAYGIDLRLEAV